MGGLWVDYNLQSNLPGLFVIGEANFSDHGANRLGASALMQGLADGYFVLPYTIVDYLNQITPGKVKSDHDQFKLATGEVNEKIKKLLSIDGKETVDYYHRMLGKLLWDKCGMARNEAGLKEALQKIPEIRQEFWENVRVPGENEQLNQSLEKAGRVADFLEFAELMCHDALDRDESCGAHFREEHQTDEGEALRDDENYSYVSAWEFDGVGKKPKLRKESLEFEEVKLAQRSYK
jgi:succinate dehydrogenase / fumarate reductase flavoprotein subunit